MALTAVFFVTRPGRLFAARAAGFGVIIPFKSTMAAITPITISVVWIMDTFLLVFVF
jgi:hypothetical protein